MTTNLKRIAECLETSEILNDVTIDNSGWVSASMARAGRPGEQCTFVVHPRETAGRTLVGVFGIAGELIEHDLKMVLRLNSGVQAGNYAMDGQMQLSWLVRLNTDDIDRVSDLLPSLVQIGVRMTHDVCVAIDKGRLSLTDLPDRTIKQILAQRYGPSPVSAAADCDAGQDDGSETATETEAVMAF